VGTRPQIKNGRTRKSPPLVFGRVAHLQLYPLQLITEHRVPQRLFQQPILVLQLQLPAGTPSFAHLAKGGSVNSMVAGVPFSGGWPTSQSSNNPGAPTSGFSVSAAARWSWIGTTINAASAGAEAEISSESSLAWVAKGADWVKSFLSQGNCVQKIALYRLPDAKKIN
jgi:hypothetical protein